MLYSWKFFIDNHRFFCLQKYNKKGSLHNLSNNFLQKKSFLQKFCK